MFPYVAVIRNNSTGDEGTLAMPPLSVLQEFSAVLYFPVLWDCWNNGNKLADYVDSGGGVVIAAYANVGQSGDFPTGRWDSSYQIIPPDPSSAYLPSDASSLGTVLVPGHPLMQGVNSFAGIGRPLTTAMTSHGLKVALWADGSTLAAVSTTRPNRADLGFVPVSQGLDSEHGWDPTTDGGRLLANALQYVMMGSCCTPSGTCMYTNQSSCTGGVSGGVWTVAGVCVPNTCTVAAGACCHGTSCTTGLSAVCSGGGVFQGPGTTCGTAGNPTTCCAANYNGVNGITVQDIFDFLNGWFGGNPQADFNHVGGITVQDIFDFLNAWFAGCS
jgi:hypothetical protein